MALEEAKRWPLSAAGNGNKIWPGNRFITAVGSRFRRFLGQIYLLVRQEEAHDLAVKIKNFINCL